MSFYTTHFVRNSLFLFAGRSDRRSAGDTARRRSLARPTATRQRSRQDQRYLDTLRRGASPEQTISTNHKMGRFNGTSSEEPSCNWYTYRLLCTLEQVNIDWNRIVLGRDMIHLEERPLRKLYRKVQCSTLCWPILWEYILLKFGWPEFLFLSISHLVIVFLAIFWICSKNKNTQLSFFCT